MTELNVRDQNKEASKIKYLFKLFELFHMEYSLNMSKLLSSTCGILNTSSLCSQYLLITNVCLKVPSQVTKYISSDNTVTILGMYY